MKNRSRASQLVWLVLAVLFLVGSATAQENKSDRDAMELGRTLVNLNDDVDVNEALDIFAERLGAHYIRDPRLSLKIKLKLSKDLTWGSFKKILDGYEIVVLEEEVKGQLLIVSSVRGYLGNLSTVPAPIVTGTDALSGREEFVTAIVPVEHASLAEVYQIVHYLDSFGPSRRGLTTLVPGSNAIVIHDLASTVDYCRRVVKALDAPSDATVTVLSLHAGDSHAIAAALERIYPRGDSRWDVCAVGSSLLVRATPQRLAEIERLVRELDAHDAGAPSVSRPRACPLVEVAPLGFCVQESERSPEGVHVIEVLPESAAAKAGLQAGDLVTAFASESVTSARDLVYRVTHAGWYTGTTAVLRVTRGTWERDVTVCPNPRK